MINSAILLLLLLLSFERAKPLENTRHQKTNNFHEKEKRETFFPFTKEKTPTQNQQNLSLSLSLSISFSLSVSRFFLSKNFGENFVLKRGSQKTKNFAPPFLILIAFSSRASPETEERTPAWKAYSSREKEHFLLH